jgi:dolichol-phosphate mannosyltransferase
VARGLVIFPTYNEAENIERIVPEVLSKSPELEALVIDDNSPDGTGDMVERMAAANPKIHLVRRPGKMGLGTAYVLGFKYVLEHGYDYCFEMDADFSHPPDKVPVMIELLKDYDMVIGSRYSDGVSVVNWPMKRLLLSYFACMYARMVTGGSDTRPHRRVQGLPARDLGRHRSGQTQRRRVRVPD